MVTQRSLFAVVVVSALSGSVFGAEPREWTSHNDKFTIDAILLDFKEGQVQLKKNDGSVIHVPLSKFCAQDRQFVKEQFPNRVKEPPVQGGDYRKWKSRIGKFTTLAKLLDYSEGKVRLEKGDCEEIVVPIEKLSFRDRAWLKGEMRRRRKSEREAEQEAERETAFKTDAYKEIIEQIDLQTVDMKLVALKLGTSQRRKKFDPTTQYMLGMTKPQRFFVQMNRGKNPYEGRFRRIVQTEPDYAVEKPFLAVAKLGSQDYAFALDAVGKNPKGYNRLYIDANCNGDLTDDRPTDTADIRGKASSGTSNSTFPQIKLAFDTNGIEVDHSFLMNVICHQTRSLAYANVLLYSGAVREGCFEQGRRKIRLVLVDCNSNGRFDDHVSVRKSGTRLVVSNGDLLLVDPNINNRRSGGATVDRDRYFVSKTVCIGKHFYKLGVTPAGDQVKLEPTELALGYVTNPSPAYRAVIYNDDYGVLMISGMKDQKVPLPEGEWKMANYTIDATKFTGGKRTTVSASFSNNAQTLAVNRDKTASFTFGAPFRPDVKVRQTRDNKVSLSLSIVGSGGERCTSFYINGKRPPEPRFEVRDQDGKVVHHGKFEYG